MKMELIGTVLVDPDNILAKVGSLTVWTSGGPRAFCSCGYSGQERVGSCPNCGTQFKGGYLTFSENIICENGIIYADVFSLETSVNNEKFFLKKGSSQQQSLATTYAACRESVKNPTVVKYPYAHTDFKNLDVYNQNILDYGIKNGLIDNYIQKAIKIASESNVKFKDFVEDFSEEDIDEYLAQTEDQKDFVKFMLSSNSNRLTGLSNRTLSFGELRSMLGLPNFVIESELLTNKNVRSAIYNGAANVKAFFEKVPPEISVLLCNLIAQGTISNACFRGFIFNGIPNFKGIDILSLQKFIIKNVSTIEKTDENFWAEVNNCLRIDGTLKDLKQLNYENKEKYLIDLGFDSKKIDEIFESDAASADMIGAFNKLSTLRRKVK